MCVCGCISRCLRRTNHSSSLLETSTTQSSGKIYSVNKEAEQRIQPDSMARFFPNTLSDTAMPAQQYDPAALCHQLKETVTKAAPKHDCDGGIYVGTGGIAYALYHLSTKPHFAPLEHSLLSSAAEIIVRHVKYCEKHAQDRGFFLGSTGVYATAALVFHKLKDEGSKTAALDRFRGAAGHFSQRGDFLGCGSDEMLVGRAGYLCGILNLRLKLQESVVDDATVNNICMAIIDSGRAYRSGLQTPLMYSYYGTEYLGAAHGLCGILQMILSFPSFLEQHPEASELVKQAVDFYLTLQQPSGNFPCATDEQSRDSLYHWCHGAPGAIYLLARASLVFKEDRYLNSAVKCGEAIWQKGLLKKGPGICHGVAGNGYAFLLLYQLTKNEIYLRRAASFAAFMQSAEFAKGARTPDCAYSLFEGLAGTMCFYADLTDPASAEFPLSPVMF